MAKIDNGDTVYDALYKMSEGNPGALSFLMATMELGIRFFMATALKLDTAELYGSHIYMLWNDCCDRDVLKTYRMIKNLDVNELKSYVIDRGYGKKYKEINL